VVLPPTLAYLLVAASTALRPNTRGREWPVLAPLYLSRVEREIREAEQAEERGTALVPRGQKKKLPYTGLYGSTYYRRHTACNTVNHDDPQPFVASGANDANNTPDNGVLHDSE